ncbi:hypothetical protein HAX54_014340, partial [Datura stramonium]|nr:hypothetical protein [Datura stramonium]
RLTKELTAHRPLDGSSLWCRGSDGRNKGCHRGDRTSWESSRLEGEDDGPSSKRWIIVCVIRENLMSCWVMVELTNRHSNEVLSHLLSLRLVESPLWTRVMAQMTNRRECDGPSRIPLRCLVVEILAYSQRQFCNLLYF